MSITKEKIERILKTLDTSKSPGPDELHPRPMAEMAEQLAEPFQALFSTTLEERILPQGWKDGNVTPIFKKGKKRQPGVYRPVSLTSIPCRVIEKLVRNEIMEHLINNNLLSKFQHGFIKARSCTTQLLAVQDDWTDVIENGEKSGCNLPRLRQGFRHSPPQATIGQTFWIRHRWETRGGSRGVQGVRTPLFLQY